MPAKQPPKSPPPDVSEIRKLREEAEALRRDVAGLNGRLDIIETFLKLDTQNFKPTESQKEFAARMGFDLPTADDWTAEESARLEKEAAERRARSEGNVLRFRADDPKQKKLGMAINYKCLHGVEWTITATEIEFLTFNNLSQCDCNIQTDTGSRSEPAIR